MIAVVPEYVIYALLLHVFSKYVKLKFLEMQLRLGGKHLHIGTIEPLQRIAEDLLSRRNQYSKC